MTVQPAPSGAPPANTAADNYHSQSQPNHRAARMEGKAYLTEEAAYKNLKQYYDSNGSKLNILQMFKEDADRFKKYR